MVHGRDVGATRRRLPTDLVRRRRRPGRDAETDADLDAIVPPVGVGRTRAVVRHGGAGGGAQRPPSRCDGPRLSPGSAARPIVALVGSDHPAAQAQFSACAVRIMVQGEAARIPDGAAVSPAPSRPVPSGAAAGPLVAETFEKLLARLDRPGTLIVTGGETLRGVCAALDARGLVVEGEVAAGLVSRLLGGAGGRAPDRVQIGRVRRCRTACPPAGGFRMTHANPQLAITMGDPAGVGPEIIVKACRKLQPRIEAGELRLLVIGHRSALHAARDLLHETLAFPETASAPLALLPAGDEREPVRFGVLSPEAGRFAYLAVERAVDLAKGGTDRRDRHRPAEQGGAEPRRLPLRRPHRHAGGADRHAALGHAAGARRHAGEPRHHPCRAGSGAEAADAGAAAPHHRPDANAR